MTAAILWTGLGIAWQLRDGLGLGEPLVVCFQSLNGPY